MSISLAGIDLAWCGEKNPSAIAIGCLNNHKLTIEKLEPHIIGLANIHAILSQQTNLVGLAIDAPLIINNSSGLRECERALSQDYRSQKASCHASNQKLYPNAFSVQLSLELHQKGFHHLASQRWQIECYPHPAMIECFRLAERLLYKKGNVADKRLGQIQFAHMLLQLESSAVLPLIIPNAFQERLTESYIHSLKGQQLKSNEDALDAIMCLYIAGLYQQQVPAITYGNTKDGYIWVPRTPCL